MHYVIGDIHGHLPRFESILDQISFTNKDHLYFLGDCIDRHYAGMQILDTIMNIPNAVLLLGNHELMMRNALAHPEDKAGLSTWLYNGGKETFYGYLSQPQHKQQKILEFLYTLPSEINITVSGTDYHLVHGAPREFMERFPNYCDDPVEYAVWTRMRPEMQMKGKTIVFGHTPTVAYQKGFPMSIWHGPNMIGMDTGSGYDLRGRLACLRLDDMTEFYSSY